MNERVATDDPADPGETSPIKVGRRSERRPATRWERWVSEPRSLVFLVLIAVVVVGGGRKVRAGLRARRAIRELERGDVSPTEIEAAVEHGRAGIMELFRILTEGKTAEQKRAAGRALSVLWARDEMVAEEEKGLVRRGFQADWRARRRYPRSLHAEIPIAVDFGVPFLGAPDGVRPDQLHWSYKVTGTRRASTGVDSAWTPGPARAEFTMIPDDFPTNGPHKLVLQARARTEGLTDGWELELPHVSFSIEFDPQFEVGSLLTMPDEARAEAFARRVGLAVQEASEDAPRYVPINADLAVAAMPAIVVETPLPCDLAHAVEIEFEGVAGRFAAGDLFVSGQGQAESRPAERIVVPIAPRSLSVPALDRPGRRRMRAHLVPDPERGWTDPDIRSVWPGVVVTDWVEVELIRL